MSNETKARLTMLGAMGTLLMLVLHIATTFIVLGRRDAKIDQLQEAKVDKSVYERDIGQIKGDIRVIACAVARGEKISCPMSSP